MTIDNNLCRRRPHHPILHGYARARRGFAAARLRWAETRQKKTKVVNLSPARQLPPPPPPEIFLLHSIGTRYIWHSIRNRINKHNCGMILTYRVSCPELQLPDWVESVCATMQSSGQKLRSLPGLTGVSAAVCHVAIWPFGNAAADSKWLTISNSPFSCPAYQSGFSLASNILVNSVTLGDGRRWEEVGGDEYNGDASSPPPLPTI